KGWIFGSNQCRPVRYSPVRSHCESTQDWVTRPRCAAAAVMRLVECNPSSRTHPWLAGVNVHRVQHLPVAGVSYGSRVPQVTAALNSHHPAGGELGNDSLTTRLRKRRTSTTGNGQQGSYGGVRQWRSRYRCRATKS